ncbi:MAG: GAF domain-containing protein [Pedobacter sp.]|nr:MAG: GAF domain-containing protein [Pedobacter sp.]
MDIIDLTNCDREPIHIPGKIQSHGFLIAVNNIDLIITYASENISAHLGHEIDELLEKPISHFISQLEKNSGSNELANVLALGKSQGFDLINPYKLLIQDQPYYLIIHESADQILLEFEMATLQYDIQHIIGRSVAEILSNKSIESLLQKAAEEVKHMIEYDRVMVYKFQEDGHGEVVAEVKNDDLEPFMGLHYPASDIPKQARELYKLNMTRIIADVNSESSPIKTFEKDTPLDLTNSSLRAVSPIHIQYLKNMGVESSFSISLLAHGELWGLIACHNYSPKFIDYKAREGSKLIGNILSSALEYRQTEVENEINETHKQAATELYAHLEKDSDIITALTKHETNLLNVNHSTGVAILFEKNIYKLGNTPKTKELEHLFNWLKLTMNDSIYYTHQLSALYKPAMEFALSASGILACMLSKDMGELIVWFKEEKLKTIHWAGNPEKPVEKAENGLMQLSPRNSFASFAEIVKNTSSKWTNAEIAEVIKLREKINNIINKRANEIRLLNERLKLAYDELDTFSYTISHDLRTPLTSIKSYTELYLAKNKNLDDANVKLLDRVLVGADKMRFLIDEILKLARVGRAEIELSKIDVQGLVLDICQDVVSAFKADHVKINVGDCPEVDGDKTLVTQVFTNIISNAVKYSAKSDQPEVFISGKLEDGIVTYIISDNGIGIEVDHHDKVFELFRRMENVKDFEGTGVGLAIVKRIMERHKGRVWFESELGKGTTFYLTFNKF